MFLTGFMFGSVLTYLICLEEELLPLEGKIGVALAAGLLCGLITMLVQYVGLFMTGLHFGLLLGIAILVVMEQFYHPTTKWITIGILFGMGLLFALLTLYFQKGLTILGSAIFGAAQMTTALDYYVEMFMMVNYVWDRVKAEPVRPVCWFSWIILGLWPAAFFIGALTQWRVTGKGFTHNEGWSAECKVLGRTWFDAVLFLINALLLIRWARGLLSPCVPLLPWYWTCIRPAPPPPWSKQ